MTGYKIQYGDYGYNCWGKPKWYGWYEYENKVYVDKNKCIEVMEDAKEQFPDRDFDIYEIEIE